MTSAIALNMPDGTRIADDVILTNVIGFDVKAWDPTAPILSDGKQNHHCPAIELRSIWRLGVTTVSYGAYVDLGYYPTSRHTGRTSPALAPKSDR